MATRTLNAPDAATGDDGAAVAALSAVAEADLTCASCGGDLAYAPSLSALLCSQCGAARDIPDLGPQARAAAVAERDFAAAARAADGAAAAAVDRYVTCSSCGATERFEAEDRARPCAFCGEPLSDAPETTSPIETHAVLPFLISAEDARERLARWRRGLWFAPNSLARISAADGPLDGVYAPYFTFDAQTTTDYAGQQGTMYTDYVWRTERTSGGLRRRRLPVRRVRWRPASGTVAVPFDGVTTSASKGLDPKLAARLDRRGWDLQGLQPVQPSYFAGFVAEAPGVSLDDGFSRARTQMERRVDQAVRADIGGDLQKVSERRIRYDAVTYRSICLPVWVARYRHNGRVFQALVNGRTGAVVGDRPYSTWKIAALAGALLACLAVALLLDA